MLLARTGGLWLCSGVFSNGALCPEVDSALSLLMVLVISEAGVLYGRTNVLVRLGGVFGVFVPALMPLVGNFSRRSRGTVSFVSFF